MTPHEHGKRWFGAVFGIGAEQLGVGLIVHLLNSSRRRANRTS